VSFSEVGLIKVADRDLAGLMKHVEDGRRRYSWRGSRVDGLRQDRTGAEPRGAGPRWAAGRGRPRDLRLERYKGCSPWTLSATCRRGGDAAPAA